MTTTEKITVDKQDAQHVLYWISPDIAGGYEAGSFTTHLIKAISVADTQNLARIAQGFPSLVEAVNLYRNDVRGIEKLKLIATSYTNGGLRFSTCPECQGQNSKDYNDLGQVSSWCGRCDGEGRLLV